MPRTDDYWSEQGWITRAELPALLEEAAWIYGAGERAPGQGPVEYTGQVAQGDLTMPANQSKNSLLAKLGDKMKKAHEAHKNDETDYGFVNLPAGISGGVAQLRLAKWDIYAQGKKYPGQPYVTLQGVVLRPKEFQGIPVEGQRVSQTISLCDQKDRKRGTPPKEVTFADNYAELLNELRKLGVNTADTGPDDIEATLQALQESKPFFRFSTRGWTPPVTPQNPKPEPMVFNQFDGVCEDPDEGGGTDAGGGTEDGSGGDAGGGDGSGGATSGADADGALSELAEQADAGDEDAQDKLRQIAKDNGVEEGPEDGSAEPNTINGAENWASVVTMIEEAQAGGGGDGDGGGDDGGGDTGPSKPEKGSVMRFAVRDAKGNVAKNPRTKKPVEPTECEVISVDAKKETCVVKTLHDKKLHKDVKYDWLEEAK